MAQNENTATGDSSDTPSGMVLEFSVSVDSIPPESRQDTLRAWCGRFSKAIRTTDAVIPIEDGDKFRFRFSSGDTATFRKGADTTATILADIAERPAGYEFIQSNYHDAIQTLSKAELLRYFKILFKNTPFINTAIFFEKKKYTVLTGGQIGYDLQTETADFGVVFLDESQEHYYELNNQLTHPYRLTGVKEGDLDKVNFPQGCEEVIIVTKDGETWHLYQGPQQTLPSRNLPSDEQKFTKDFFFLTPEGLRRTIDNQIFFRAEVVFNKLQEAIIKNQNRAAKLEETMAVLGQFPGRLLPGSLQNLTPEMLTDVAERLGGIAEIISPEDIAVMQSGGISGFHEGAGT